MSSDTANREASRDKLAALLQTALVGTGKPAAAVYGYQLGDFGGQSPVVLVVSSGTKRVQGNLGVGAKNRNEFRLTLMNFVSAADTGTSWTEANVEDRLDLLEKMESDVLADNRGKANDASLPWHYIEASEDYSQIAAVTIGGARYWLETFEVIVTVKDT